MRCKKISGLSYLKVQAISQWRGVPFSLADRQHPYFDLYHSNLMEGVAAYIKKQEINI